MKEQIKEKGNGVLTERSKLSTLQTWFQTMRGRIIKAELLTETKIEKGNQEDNEKVTHRKE
jgi:hypothetical protein